MNKASKFLILCSAVTLSACSTSSGRIQDVQVGEFTVREVPVGGSSSTASELGQNSVFVISPVASRPIEQRISIVEQYLAIEGRCQLGTTDHSFLDALSRGADGDGNRVLMAPVKC